MLVEGRTEVRPERIPASLADQFLGRPLPPIRREVPENVQKPSCDLNVQAWHVTDLHVEWDISPGANSYRSRDVSGLLGTPKEMWEAASADPLRELYQGSATRFTIPQPGAGQNAADPALITDIMIEPYNAHGVIGECYTVTPVSKLVVPGIPCTELIFDSSRTATYCNPNVVPGPVVLRSPPLVVLLSDIASQVTEGVTPLALCHEGSSLSFAPQLNGWGNREQSFIAGFNHFRLDRVDNAVFSNPYGHSNNTGGVNTTPKWNGVSLQDSGASSTVVRAIHGNTPSPSAAPNVESSALCCHEDTTDFYGESFQPGVAAFGGGAGAVQVLISQGYKRPYWEIENLSSQKIRLERDAGYRFLGAASFQSTGTFTGTGKESTHGGNNRAGGRYHRIKVLDASDVEDAVFTSSEHPLGRIDPGDRYTYDSGGTLAVGVGGVIAVNAAKTLGLLEAGLIYHEDWEALPAGTVDTTKYLVVGTPVVTTNDLEMFAGDYIVRQDQGSYPECVSEAVIRVDATSDADCSAWVVRASPDVKAALRITFNDPGATQVLSSGAGTGLDLSAFVQELAWQGVWPVGATQATIEQLQIGAAAGQSCSRNVSLVTGTNCCSGPGLPPLPGLPPGQLDCLLPVTLAFVSMADCASGGGITMRVDGAVQTTSTCPNLALPPPTSPGPFFGFEFQIFEEYTPGASPSPVDLVRWDVNPIPVPQANPLGGAPVPFSYTFTITNEDPAGRGPGGGGPRASDGISPQNRVFFVDVILKDFIRSVQVRQTPRIFGVPLRLLLIAEGHDAGRRKSILRPRHQRAHPGTGRLLGRRAHSHRFGVSHGQHQPHRHRDAQHLGGVVAHHLALGRRGEHRPYGARAR